MPDWHLFPDYMQQINLHIFKTFFFFFIILTLESPLKHSRVLTQCDLKLKVDQP